ncbi:MAG: hypothetical protein C5B57_07720 [Blastocatellia bacterium]|nr:MAG: hypothetical protein C5B57_07720 [Blastocatellia bacterium]
MPFGRWNVRLNTRLARVEVTAVVIGLALASPLLARAANEGSAAGTVDVAKIRIDNFGQINPTYYRGSQPKGRDYADLAALGIKTLIDLTSGDGEADENSMTERAGMKHVQIPMSTREPPTPAQLATFLNIVNDPANQPIYVHCVGGRHRTGVMTAVYRMAKDAWTADQAFKEMKRYKFGADFLHPEFKSFVYGFRGLVHEAPSQSVVATQIGK